MQFCVLFSEFKILPPLPVGGHRWAAQVVKHVSDQGNQHNNRPQQDQSFG